MPSARTLYTFPTTTFIENIICRPNGDLLLTTFREGSLFSLNPNSTKPEAQLVAKLPSVGFLTGIVQIAPDVYAVTGANHSRPKRFVRGSFKVFTVDLQNGIENAVLEIVMSIDDTEILNGMANVPEKPHILLSVDSVEGRVFRINLETTLVDVVLQHDSMAYDLKSDKVDIGINGAKVRDDFFYFTNSNKELFCRVPISSDGSITGEVEMLVRNQKAEEDTPYDDFTFDHNGNVYAATHPDKVFHINAGGKQELLVGGDGSGLIQSPTSVAVSNDGNKIYVACAGKIGEFKGKVIESSCNDCEL